ncbi:hypothetical protein [Hyphobacterium sp.]|uniref:hypothetical protein n=1 Tax=Hyphobacterium sp. TaxID=2004662 RepID=UPI003B52BAE4
MDLMPEASSAPPAVRRRYKWRSLFLSAGFVLAFLGSTVIGAREGQLAAEIVLVVLAFLFLVGLGYEFVTLMRALDELQQVIQTRAMAIGFAGILIALTLFGMLSEIFGDGGMDAGLSLMASLAMPAGLVAYIVALHFVKRRYE